MDTPNIYASTTPDVSVKILSVEFYKKLTRTLVDASLADERSEGFIRSLKNFWVLLWCFWGAIRFTSRIDAKTRKRVEEKIARAPVTLIEAREMLYEVFGAAALSGIFVDFNMMVSDYDTTW